VNLFVVNIYNFVENIISTNGLTNQKIPVATVSRFVLAGSNDFPPERVRSQPECFLASPN
jgi:hypothetical protein